MTADNKKSIGELKAELEAEGYEFGENDYGASVYWHDVYSPDGWIFEAPSSDNVVKVAYRHLQARRELDALRAFVLNIDGFDALISIVEIENRYDEIRGEAHRLISQFNITTDNDSLSHDDIINLRRGNNQRIPTDESDESE